MTMVLCENLFNQKLWVSPASAGAFRRHGGFDVPALELIEYLARSAPGAVAADIGANIGNHTVVMAKFCARVLSFEPRLIFEDHLRKNVEQNGLTNCQLVAAGLSDKSGIAPMFFDGVAEGGTTTFVRALAGAGTRSVDAPLYVGDEYFAALKLERLDIVKLDVEGMEASVVAGLAKTIAAFQPIFLMEWNNDVTRAAFKARQLFETVFRGYAVFGVRGREARELYPKSVLGWARRKLARLAKARGFVAVAFEPEKNFETLVLMPRTRLDQYPKLAGARPGA
jgi:FkbM family methyltransferase